MDTTPPEDESVERFWAQARKVAGFTRLDVVVGENELAALTPPAWSFGANAEEADELLALVIAGVKTATASSPLRSGRRRSEELPRPGDLSIICDGAGEPHVLVRTTAVDVVPFDQVPAEHAAAEGEGDRSLEHWRRVHEAYFRTGARRVRPGVHAGHARWCSSGSRCSTRGRGGGSAEPASETRQRPAPRPPAPWNRPYRSNWVQCGGGRADRASRTRAGPVGSAGPSRSVARLAFPTGKC